MLFQIQFTHYKADRSLIELFTIHNQLKADR